jgi:hypothetical protein
LPDQPDLQYQQEGPDKQLLWPLPQLLPVKAHFLSLEPWGDSQAAEIKLFELKQSDKNKIYSTKPPIDTNILCVG